MTYGHALGWNPYEESATRDLVSGLYVPAPGFDDSPLPPSFCLAQYHLWPKNQGPVGTCFPPGTHIRMADGSERKIEDVRLLERVVTAEGRTGRVRQLMARDIDEPIVSLQLWGHGHLRMTCEHPVLTERGYVPAEELTSDDFVAMPRYLPNQTGLIDTSDHVKLGRNYLRQSNTRTYSGVKGRSGLTAKQVQALPAFVHLTSGFGRLLGLFLAEGSTDYGKVTFTFADDEEFTLAIDVENLLRDELGIDAHVRKVPEHHVVRVTAYGTHWANLFESLCACGAARKRIHPELMGGPSDFLDAMLNGWLDGDGFARHGGVIGSTISHDLALGMFDIGQAIGRSPAIRQAAPQQNRYAKVRQPVWHVTFKSKEDNWRLKTTASHVWRKVREIDYDRYIGPVFNLSVEGDESYVAEGVGVHNCYANAGCTAFETQTAAEKAAGKPWDVVPLSRSFIAYWATQVLSPGRNPADGGTISAVFASMADPPEGRGVCHESAWPYKPNRHDLAIEPNAEAMSDASHNRLHQIAKLEWDTERVQRAIAALHIPEIGINWPACWDRQGATWIDDIDQIVGGHAITILGWHTDDRGLWWLIANSHGSIYEPARIRCPGYSGSSLGYCFWASDRALSYLMNQQWAECQIAAGMDGFRSKPVWKWDELA